MCFHVWRQWGVPGNSSSCPCLLFSPLQLKVYARVWKQGWWMWPCGWGPAQTTPEVMHLQAGIQYLESSLRNCPNKENKNGAHKGRDQYNSMSSCPPKWSGMADWRSHSIADGNWNVCVLFKYYTSLKAYTEEYCHLSTTNKLCTVSSLLIGAGGLQKPYNRGLTDDF